MIARFRRLGGGAAAARRRALVLACVAALAGPANAGAEEDATAIADRYLALMQRKGYAFLSEAELTRRRDEVARFVRKHLKEPMGEATRAAVLDGVDRCIDRLYAIPAGTVHYGGGHGGGGEEWVYIHDRDFFLTFLYHLWVGLTCPPLTAERTQQRDAQREWMREYLTYGPWREGSPARNEKIRPRVLAELESSFADPLDLLSAPMPDDAFSEMRRQFRDASRGIGGDLNLMRVTALAARFPSQRDPAGRYRHMHPGELPFDDAVVGLWVNGPHLCFSSNAEFRGGQGGMSPSDVYDVVRCLEMRTKPAPAPGSPPMEEWLATEGRGDLTLDGSRLVAVRGAKIARLKVMNWFDADQLSEEQLRDAVRDEGCDRISIEGLPKMNGPHRGDRSEGEFFIVVRSREDRLAVLVLNNYEFNQLWLWCRPRAARP